MLKLNYIFFISAGSKNKVSFYFYSLAINYIKNMKEIYEKQYTK